MKPSLHSNMGRQSVFNIPFTGRSTLLAAPLFLLALFLPACGGGGGSTGGPGGSTPSSYAGLTNRAPISQSNTSVIVQSNWNGMQVGGGLSSFMGVLTPERVSVVGKPARNARPSITDMARVLPKERKSPRGRRSAQPITTYGDCGGSEVVTLSGTQSSYSGALTDSTFCQGGTTYNGTVTFTSSSSAGSQSLSLSFTSYGFKDASMDVALDGTANFSQTTGTSVTSETMTYSMTVRDNLQGKQYMENYSSTRNITSANGSYTETISGRHYLADFGFVEMSTPTPLSYSRAGSNPAGGVLVITGANNSKLRVTFADTGYTVESDYDGTGSYASVGNYSYDSTVAVNTTGTAIPAAPAGLTAVEGVGRVALTWSEVPGATSYNIYWSSSPGVTTSSQLIDTVVSSSYMDAYPIDGVNYYAVTAVNAAGESAVSNEVSGTPVTGGPVTANDLVGTWNMSTQDGYDVSAISGLLIIDSSLNYTFSQKSYPALGATACTESGAVSVSGNTMTISVASGDCGVAAGTVFTQQAMITGNSLTVVRGASTFVFIK